MAFDAEQDVSDEALLDLYGKGDRMAARMLALRFAPLAFRVAYRMLGDRSEAEDLAQEAMLRLWRIAPEWRAGEAKVSTWLYRVVSNLATDRLRKRRGVGLDEVPEIEDGAASALDRMAEEDRVQALHRALDGLPERQRQAIVLRHLEGLSNPEIAEAMQIGVEAVESLTARGKRALRALLAGERGKLGYDDD